MYMYKGLSLATQWSLWSATNKMANLTPLLVIALAAFVPKIVLSTLNQVPLPTVNLTEWWGSGNASNEDTNIYNFTIDFNETVINDLLSRVNNTRPLASPLEDINFEYGFNSDALKLWMKYLVEEYPFQERIAFLNQYSHFKTSIQGMLIHFIRATSENATQDELVPLVILHGWPGSVREFYESIPYLLSKAEAQGIALDIIIPSLPGFGFSEGPVRPGLGVDKAAVVLRNLMHRLGYSKYYLQGGDMGGMVTMNWATLFTTEVLGYHTNFPFVHTTDMIFRLVMGNFHKEEVAQPQLLDRIYPSWTKFFWYVGRIGYLHIHSTRPDTFGIGLTDSPAGLMAHTLITTGTPNNTGSVPAVYYFDNFIIYWFTNCAPTGMRLYAETFNKRYVGLRMNEIRTPVPTWVLQAPNEIMYLPPWMLKQKFTNLLNETLPSTGGHFYAWEHPEPFAEDVVTALVAFKKWHVMNNTMYTNCSSYINE